MGWVVSRRFGAPVLLDEDYGVAKTNYSKITFFYVIPNMNPDGFSARSLARTNAIAQIWIESGSILA